MASLPLYRVKSYIRVPRWAKFPEDFDVVGHSILDDDLIDHPDVASYRWCMDCQGKVNIKRRAKRISNVDGKTTSIWLHRVIWEIARGDIPGNLTVDHKNRDPLDNRIQNLRLATRKQQTANTSLRSDSQSGYKGVYLYKPAAHCKKHWAAFISPACYSMCTFGYHATPHHAAFAYNIGASLFYGEFAALNEIPDGLVPLEDQKVIQESVKTKLIARKLIPDPKSLQTSSHA